MEITFKKATLLNLPQVLSLMKRYKEEANYDFDPRSLEKKLTLFLKDPKWGYIWLIQKEMHTIGYFILIIEFSFDFEGSFGSLDEIFIEKPFRNQGVGTQSLDFLGFQCKELGLEVLYLEVEVENKNAIQLYENQGFKVADWVSMIKRIN